MAIEYSLNKIKNFFVGKDILGRDAIVHSRVTFLMKRVPKEMADATRAGYLSHASCFVNLPYPAIGDWDDQIPPIIRVEEFTLTEEGREQLDELYDVNLVQADKDDTLDTWQSQWEEEAGSICSSLCDTLMESINVSGENVALLNTCKQYFTSHEFGNLEGKNLSIALLLSYVIEYIAREKFMYSNDELSRFYLSGVTEEAGWVRFSFSDGERNDFDIRADGFFPTYYKIYPSYSMSADSKNSLEEKLQKETDLFLQNNAEALNHDVWTAAYTVNEWLCQNVTYTDEKNIQNGQYYPYNSIVAPLLRKEAICSGYAKTFAYLMNKAGYEAAYCTGYTNGGIYHAWNAIVYNGEITYIDSTYNASGNHMAYFCRNKEDLKERTENSIIWFSASDD